MRMDDHGNLYSPRYRILVRWIDGEQTFYPQYRGWFLWHDYPDSSPGGGRIFFTNKTLAADFIIREREMDRARARANSNPRANYVAMTFDE